MGISSRLTELKEKRDYYQMELDTLHMAEPHESYYKARRYELECQIVNIEDAIDDLEREQKMMRPFFWTTVAFAIAASLMLLYRIVQTKM
jgi:hypothetical protein